MAENSLGVALYSDDFTRCDEVGAVKLHNEVIGIMLYTKEN